MLSVNFQLEDMHTLQHRDSNKAQSRRWKEVEKKVHAMHHQPH